MSKVIVTGVNGFVGHHLARELKQQGWEVIGVGTDQEAASTIHDSLNGYYTCDLTDYDSVSLLPLKQVRAVINLAGLAAVGPSFDQPDLYMRVNTSVLDTLCKAAIEQDVKDIRLLAISSGAVYGLGQQMPLTEESLLNPDSSPYAASKIAMEELAASYRNDGLDCVVARPFNHIGPGQAEGFILPDLYKKLIVARDTNDKILVGNLTTKRDYTDVRDVAQAYINLISQDELDGGIYNVCSGRSFSGEEILAHLTHALGFDDVVVEVDEKLFRPSDAPNLYGDNSRLLAATGWRPSIALDQTIGDFVSSKK